jgi:hypothetical protein
MTEDSPVMTMSLLEGQVDSVSLAILSLLSTIVAILIQVCEVSKMLGVGLRQDRTMRHFGVSLTRQLGRDGPRCFILDDTALMVAV